MQNEYAYRVVVEVIACFDSNKVLTEIVEAQRLEEMFWMRFKLFDLLERVNVKKYLIMTLEWKVPNSSQKFSQQKLKLEEWLEEEVANFFFFF